MLPYYLALDLPIDASDQDIRSRYIELVKKYSPEKEPELFRQVTQAYEAIKNKRKRVETKIFAGIRTGDFEASLYSLIKKEEIKPKRVGLRELLKVCGE